MGGGAGKMIGGKGMVMLTPTPAVAGTHGTAASSTLQITTGTTEFFMMMSPYLLF
jgi:hypothetical protein